MATTLNDLVPYVLPDVPGAGNNIIKLRMREALRVFCMDTEVWRENVVMDQVDGQSEYEITLSNEAAIQRIMFIKVKTSDSQSFDDVNHFPVRTYYLNNDGDTIVFLNNNEPGNDITDGIQFQFALRPTFQTEDLSGDLIDRYGEAIFNLTKYKLLTTAKTSYYNPDAARHFYNEYRNSRMTAIREKTIGHKAQGLQVAQLGNILG